MKNNLLILLLFQLFFSCSTSNVLSEIPKTYSFEIKWGLISPKNEMQKLIYNTNANELILYKTFQDSIISSETFKITKAAADSIFYLCHENSNENSIAETNEEMILNSYIFQVSLMANGKTLTDNYGSRRNSTEKENRLNEIYAIINRVTLNEANLND